MRGETEAGGRATSTWMLKLIKLPALVDLARACLYLALAAWLATFLGLLRSLLGAWSEVNRGR